MTRKSYFPVVASILILLWAVPGQAQTVLNSTTLSAAVATTSQRSFQLASASNITANTHRLLIGVEMLVVTSVNTTTNIVQVSRTGTATTHGVGDNFIFFFLILNFQISNLIISKF